jgi:DNA (cytosine-5)-methyltransferase 1
MNKEKIKAIDLFSGCGGVSCGLTHAGFKVVTAVEIEPSAAATYKNYEPLSKVNVLVDDICNLSGQRILTAGGIDKDEIYLLAGCPPCQNFSFQNRENKNKSEEVRKKLLFNFSK